MTLPETRTARINRLRQQLRPITRQAAHIATLGDEPEYRELVELFADATFPVQDAADYMFARSWVLVSATLDGLARRSDSAAVVNDVLDQLASLHIYCLGPALTLIAANCPAVDAGAPLLRLADNSRFPLRHVVARRQMARVFGNYFGELERRAVPLAIGDAAESLDDDDRRNLGWFLAGFGHPVATELGRQLAATAPPPVPPPAPPPRPSPPEPSEPSFFDKVGRFWSQDEAKDVLDVGPWKAPLAAAARTVSGQPPRSLLVVGHAQTGKSSLLKLLGRSIAGSGWRVFEASANDFIADNIYIGQVEGLLRQALRELAPSKQIVWYVPDILGFAQSGSHRHNSATLIDQIMPAVASGQIVLWGEADPQAAERLLRLKPALRRSLEAIRLDALSVDDTRPLAANLAEVLSRRYGVASNPSVARAAVDAAVQHFSPTSLPGSALSLVCETMQRAGRKPGTTVTDKDVLRSLANATGLPLSLLDGGERIDLTAVAAFFTKRVIGQHEAVQTIVERIAMLKAGLNDPAKPLGVFLFAGPTGTGKTELAKAAAEFLFGSAERMIRVDMSEFGTQESIAKLIGGPYQPEHSDTLINRVRRQPFSVVLLDEFEKAHWSIWDLCLQLLDEGRLTDHHGQTADFRNCLIILTTNLGATTHQSSGLGFAPGQGAYSSDQIMRALGEVFRPEFQNRLDKVVVFKPLTRELMRGILTKELARLYERRGLKQRDWAIEWEASAIEFLLEKGFNAEMGARPLKRAIDTYVAVPLATAIVERRAPDKEQFVFMRSDGTALQAEFIHPDGERASAVAAAAPAVGPADTQTTVAGMVLSPRGTKDEVRLLADTLASIEARIGADAWADKKQALADSINARDFWERSDRFDVLTRFELMDRVAVAVETAGSLHGRLARLGGQPGTSARDVIARLASRLLLIQEGLRDVDEETPVEVALAIEPALDGHAADAGARQAWHDEIAGMYRAWCRKRGMLHVEVPSPANGHAPVLLVSGFGAHRTLMREAGLHVFEQPGAKGNTARLAVRVLVVPSPAGQLSDSERQTSITEALAQLPRTSTVVRRYRRSPSPLVRDREWRSGKIDAVLGGDFDVIEQSSG